MDATRPRGGLPERVPIAPIAVKDDRNASHRTPVFYRAPAISVTAAYFVVGGRRFPVAELSDLRTARGPHDPLAIRAAIGAGVVLAGIGVALSATGELHRLGTVGYVGLGSAALLPALVAVVGRRLRPPDFELWGRYQGRTVLLFSTDQEREFGQVSRALLRAREVAQYGGMTEPVASRLPWQAARR